MIKKLKVRGATTRHPANPFGHEPHFAIFLRKDRNDPISFADIFSLEDTSFYFIKMRRGHGATESIPCLFAG